MANSKKNAEQDERARHIGDHGNDRAAEQRPGYFIRDSQICVRTVRFSLLRETPCDGLTPPRVSSESDAAHTLEVLPLKYHDRIADIVDRAPSGSGSWEGRNGARPANLNSQ
jgi:hypothetical protein